MISPFGYIVDKNMEISPNGEIDFEKDIAFFESGFDEIHQLLSASIKDQERYHPPPDTRLRLELAICHPVLGGELMMNRQHVKSPNFSRSTLFEAIKRGELKHCFKAGKYLVSENDLREWLLWQDNEQARGFGKSQHVTTRTEAQPQPRGISVTRRLTENKLKSQRESALERLTKSKEGRLRSQNTSNQIAK